MKQEAQLATQEEWAQAYYDLVWVMERLLVQIHEETEPPNDNAVPKIREITESALRALLLTD